MIEFRGLTKRYGSTTAVEDLMATVRAGRVTAFLGPNGAGKTTTLRMLMGLVSPTSGTATIEGRPYRQLERPLRAAGALLEASGFNPGRTARGHLRAIAIAGGLDRGAAERALEAVELSEHAQTRVGSFSLGMRQRLALAAAILGGPRVLVLDEPTNGLDPQGIRWLRGELRRYAREGRTVLISSHLMAEVEQIADELLIIVGGRLVGAGTPGELRRHAPSVSEVRSPDASRLSQVLERAGLTVRRPGETELVVDAGAERVGALAAEHAIVLHRLVESGGLESAFLALVEAAER